MQVSSEQKKTIALGIHDCGLLNFGDFVFKSGVKSPMYMNLRNIGSYPVFLKQVTSVFVEIMQGLSYDLVAGIPYGAIPLMMSVSLETETPVIFPRKESKEYGMGKDLIGEYREGQVAVVVDDLVTDGGSKVESMVPFNSAGIKVDDYIVILDYQRGATELLAEQGQNLYSIMSVKEAVDFIYDDGRISDEEYNKAADFLVTQ